MKIQAILTEKELNEAIMAYIVKAGYPVSGMDVNIELTKGRKGNGTYATIEFSPEGSVKTETVEEAVAELDEEIATEEETETAEVLNFAQETVEETPVEEPVEEVSPKKSLFG